MKFSTVRLVCTAALCGAFALTISRADAAPPKTKPAPGEEITQAVQQADGITNRIQDKLDIAADRYFHDGDYNRVIAMLRIAVEADPNDNNSYENMAYLLWSQGYTPAADAILSYGLARTKNKGDLSFEFGEHLFRTKRYQQAEPYLAQSIQYPDPQPRYYATLGHCYEKNGKLPEALTTWQALVQKFPDFASGPTNLNRVLALQKKP